MSRDYYRIEACGRSGPFAERNADTWPEFLEKARELVAKYGAGDCMFMACRPDCCDEGYNGLTDEEEEQLDEIYATADTPERLERIAKERVEAQAQRRADKEYEEMLHADRGVMRDEMHVIG